MPQSSSFEFGPDYAFAPGETLIEILQEMGMSQADLARRAGLSVKHINQIVQGAASISADTALRLERVTATPARFWTGLEAAYQFGRIEAQEVDQSGEIEQWLETLPIKELQDRGWLSRTSDRLNLLREVLTFFQVATPKAWSNVWAVETAYRKSLAFEPNYGALASWIRIGEIKADYFKLPEYNRNLFRSIIPEARLLTKLSSSDQPIDQLTELCRHCGVSVVVEQEIPGSRINGVVRWLPSGNPLIMLSMRHRWADIFWFTFFHEAGHLLVHDRKRATFVDTVRRDDPEAPSSVQAVENQLLEAEADDFASRTLIPKSHDTRLRSIGSPQEVLELAGEIDIHPGIVVGRLQHDQVIRYNQMNGLRDQFKFANER